MRRLSRSAFVATILLLAGSALAQGDDRRAIRDAQTGLAVALPVPLVSAGAVAPGTETVKFDIVSETGKPTRAPDTRQVCAIGVKVPAADSPLRQLAQVQLNADEVVQAGIDRLKASIAKTDKRIEDIQRIAFANGAVNGAEFVLAPGSGRDHAQVRQYMAVAYMPNGIITLGCATLVGELGEARELFRFIARNTRITP
ncbi:hypothetical protein ACLBXM_12955 [Xanthobacteraceae bacterium A53D]